MTPIRLGLRQLGDDLGVADPHDVIETIVADQQPDIVVVATQTDLHFPLGMQVLTAAGAHLDIEKPITFDLEQADQLIATAASRGTRIAVHHQGGSLRSLAGAKGAIAAGRIGLPLHVTARGTGYYGGYELLNIGTHMLNALIELMDPIGAVSATLTTDDWPVTNDDIVLSPNGMGTIADERISATLAFKSGVTGTLLQHMLPLGATTNRELEIVGTSDSNC